MGTADEYALAAGGLPVYEGREYDEDSEAAVVELYAQRQNKITHTINNITNINNIINIYVHEQNYLSPHNFSRLLSSISLIHQSGDFWLLI